MTSSACDYCGAQLPIRKGPGRPRIYCGRSCSESARLRIPRFSFDTIDTVLERAGIDLESIPTEAEVRDALLRQEG